MREQNGHNFTCLTHFCSDEARLRQEGREVQQDGLRGANHGKRQLQTGPLPLQREPLQRQDVPQKRRSHDEGWGRQRSDHAVATVFVVTHANVPSTLYMNGVA